MPRVDEMTGRTVYLLSPASLHGKRARGLIDGTFKTDLARRFVAEGAPIGEVFTFISALYFRGKLTYARRFAAPDDVWIISSGRGLVAPDWRLDLDRTAELRRVEIAVDSADYRRPLERDVQRLLDSSPPSAQAPGTRYLLLGSIATPKYIGVLEPLLGERLVTPSSFVGVGDMRRGSLLLRAVAEGRELDACPVRALDTRT